MRKLLLIILILLGINLKPELLVVKEVGEQFEPLSEADIINHGDAISKIMLKYQWPMCILSKDNADPAENIAPEEANELLTQDKPYAEEIFIEQKLRDISPNYRVVFIPTCIYEIFCMLEAETLLKSYSIHNPFKAAKNKASDFLTYSAHSKPHEYSLKENVDQILDIQDQTSNSQQRLLKIKNAFKANNKLFYDKNFLNNYGYTFNQSAFMSLNNTITTELFIQFPKLKPIEHDESQKFEDYLEKINTQYYKNPNIKNSLRLSNKIKNLCSNKFTETGNHANIEKFNFFEDPPHYETKKKLILKKVINFEYRARKKNNAILLRGSKFDKTSKLGSAITDIKVEPIWHGPANKNIPYSISFANSLFAGFKRDAGASAYRYLDKEEIGFGLFINKKDYFNQGKTWQLFLIAPLASANAIWQAGENFHSRTRVSDINFDANAGKEYKIKGWQYENPYKHYTDYIIIKKDLNTQAKEFSKFVATNGYIINLMGKDIATGKYVDSAIIDAQIEKALGYKIQVTELNVHKLPTWKEMRRKIGKQIFKSENLINLSVSLSVLNLK